MSRIEPVNLNRFSQPKQNAVDSNIASKQSFGRGFSDLPDKSKKDIVNILVGDINPKLDKELGWGPLRKTYEYLAHTKGEMQNQLVNALFTTTLAPFFIAFNPFSDKSKEDKEYLALRQPISAVIALTGGAAMTKGVNVYLDKLYNEGFNKAIDLRMEPNNSYLKSIYKKSDAKSKGVKFDDWAKDFKAKRKETFTMLYSENPDNIQIKDKVISLKDTNKVIGRDIPNLDTPEALKEYLDKNNLHNRKLSDLLKEEFNFEFYEDGKAKPTNLNSRLSEVKAIDFLSEIGLVEKGKVDDSKLKQAVLNIRQDKYKGALAETLGISKEKAKKAFEIVGMDTSRNIEMSVGEDVGKASSMSMGQLFHQLGYKVKDGKIQEFINQPIPKALDKLKEIFNGKLEDFNNKADLKYFTENILKNKITKLGSYASNHKTWIGIITNIFTTGVTCTVLNWAYPRIVEALFPNLVAKHPAKAEKKGGNK